MATSNTNQNSTDLFLRDLLECPVCIETIRKVPVYQCANGHVICKDCIEKLNNCPICRDDSALRRNLKLESVVQRLEDIQFESEGPPTGTPNLQKWGKVSVRSYGTINEQANGLHAENAALKRSLAEALQYNQQLKERLAKYERI